MFVPHVVSLALGGVNPQPAVAQAGAHLLGQRRVVDGELEGQRVDHGDLRQVRQWHAAPHIGHAHAHVIKHVGPDGTAADLVEVRDKARKALVHLGLELCGQRYHERRGGLVVVEVVIG